MEDIWIHIDVDDSICDKCECRPICKIVDEYNYDHREVTVRVETCNYFVAKE